MRAHETIEAPLTATRDPQIEEHEAVDDRKFPAIEEREIQDLCETVFHVKQPDHDAQKSSTAPE